MDDIFDNLLLTLALGGLAVSLALFASALLYPYLRSAWNKATALARAAFCGAVVVACLFGGAKHKTGGITYPKTDTDVAYLVDAGSYVTNDAVHVAFTRVIVPDTATFYLDYCALDATNAQGVATNWVNAKTATFADLTVPFDFAFAAATNYNWMAYTDWTPGPAVQTNGVWHAYWGIDKKEGRYFIPVRTCVRDGSSVIATPKSKWDYEDTEEYWYKHYAPNTAIRVNTSLADSLEVEVKPTGDGSTVTTTIDWGDGETTSVALGKSEQALKHTYAKHGEYTIVISDTVSRPVHYYGYSASYKYVTAMLRWGDSVTSAYEAFVNCPNFVKTARWNDNITTTYMAYQACSSFKGPAYNWNDKTTNATRTYCGCTNLEGDVPAWGASVTEARYCFEFNYKISGKIKPWPTTMRDTYACYRQCYALEGAWTDDPDELMPSHIIGHNNTVDRASAAIRALFYSDWAGSRSK